MMLLLLVLRNYTRKLTHAIMIFMSAFFERVAAVQTQWFKNIFNLIGINMSEVVEVSLIS